MKYIKFELSMPNRGSWNNKWAAESTPHYHIKRVKESEYKTYQDKIDKFLDKKDFYYSWDDGWTACISAELITLDKARELKKSCKGIYKFYGYEWMIDSIIWNCEIKPSNFTPSILSRY